MPDKSLCAKNVVSNVYVHDDEDERLNTNRSLQNIHSVSNLSVDGYQSQIGFKENDLKSANMKDHSLFEEDLEFMNDFISNVDNRELQLQKINDLERKEEEWIKVGVDNKDLNIE